MVNIFNRIRIIYCFRVNDSHLVQWSWFATTRQLHCWQRSNHSPWYCSTIKISSESGEYHFLLPNWKSAEASARLNILVKTFIYPSPPKKNLRFLCLPSFCGALTEGRWTSGFSLFWISNFQALIDRILVDAHISNCRLCSEEYRSIVHHPCFASTFFKSLFQFPNGDSWQSINPCVCLVSGGVYVVRPSNYGRWSHHSSQR